VIGELTSQTWYNSLTNHRTLYVVAPLQHGGFLSHCQNHCQAGSDAPGEGKSPYPWTAIKVGGMPMGKAFSGWYSYAQAIAQPVHPVVMAGGGGGGISGMHRFFESCPGVRPCGADTCRPQGP
jgi:hypothetical protein